MGCRWRGSLREFTGTRGGVDVQVRVTVTCANNQVSRENSPMESRGVKIEAFRLIFPIDPRPDGVLISYLLNKRRFIVLNSISPVEPLWLCQSCERSARGALFYSQIWINRSVRGELAYPNENRGQWRGESPTILFLFHRNERSISHNRGKYDCNSASLGTSWSQLTLA